MRKKAGRPMKGEEALKNRTVTLSDSHVEAARKIGSGNVSAGIRVAVDLHFDVISFSDSICKSANPLDNIGSLHCIDRTYFGGGPDKPDEDCIYHECAEPPGWYETDSSLRRRIQESLG